MTLLVMAAGMGSRYGGLKQLDPIGPHGEFILDYTVYDAKAAGFDRVVFVIKEENLELFRETVGNRIGKKIRVDYCFQSIDDLPQGFSVPEGRTKQWGTAHAELPLCMAGFVLKNTLTENGTVSRGECRTDEAGRLTDITERTKIKRLDDGRTAYFENDVWNPISEDAIVSMNCWGLPADFFAAAEDGFVRFLESGGDETKKEYYLPDAVKYYMNKKGVAAKVLLTKAKWFGVTYHEDRESVVNHVRSLIENGIYPEELWK